MSAARRDGNNFSPDTLDNQGSAGSGAGMQPTRDTEDQIGGDGQARQSFGTRATLRPRLTPALATPDNIAAAREMLGEGEPYVTLRFTRPILAQLYAIPEYSCQRPTAPRIESGRADHLRKYDPSHHVTWAIFIGPDIVRAILEFLDGHCRRKMLQDGEIVLEFLDVCFIWARTREEADERYHIHVSNLTSEDLRDRHGSDRKAVGLVPFDRSPCTWLSGARYSTALLYAAAMVRGEGEFTAENIFRDDLGPPKKLQANTNKKYAPLPGPQRHKLLERALRMLEVLDPKASLNKEVAAAMLFVLDVAGPAAAVTIDALLQGLGGKDSGSKAVDVIYWLRERIAKVLKQRTPDAVYEIVCALLGATRVFVPKPGSGLNPWRRNATLSWKRTDGMDVTRLRDAPELQEPLRAGGIVALENLLDGVAAQVGVIDAGPASARTLRTRTKLVERSRQLRRLIDLAA